MEYGAEGAVATEWDPDEIARHATRVTAIKEKLYEKAGRNITEAQKKIRSTMTRSTVIHRYIYICT